MFSNLLTSWRTTLAGVLVIIFNFLGGNISDLIDGNPETVVEFADIATELALYLLGVLGILSRDNVVSDEEVNGLPRPSQFKK